MGECVDTQVDQGVDGRHPSSHLLAPSRDSFSDGQEKRERTAAVQNYKMS